MAEQGTFNPKVVSSILTGPTPFLASLVTNAVCFANSGLTVDQASTLDNPPDSQSRCYSAVERSIQAVFSWI